jgi:hypothetical protein
MLSVGTGLKLKTSEDGPAGPITVDELFTSLARIAVIRPENVKPVDDEARQRVEMVRREPETRRLVALLAVQRRAPIVRVPARATARPRERRAASRRGTNRNSGSRGDPSRSDDDEPDDLEAALPVGGAA